MYAEILEPGDTVEEISSIAVEDPKKESVSSSSGDGGLAEELFPNVKIASGRSLHGDSVVEGIESSKVLDKRAEESFNEEEKRTWSKDLRRAIIVLEDNGYLNLIETPKSEKRTVVFDVSRVKKDGNMGWNEMASDIGRFAIDLEKASEKGHPIRRDQMEVYADLSMNFGLVFSKEDYERSLEDPNVKPKDLFYVPKADPLDPKNIRKEDFYMGLWEAADYYNNRIYPSRDGKFYRTQEVVSSAIVFHPSYGNGVRDENGVLNVTYPNGKRSRINGDLFKMYGYSGSRSLFSGSLIWHSPKEFFRRECPNVLKEGNIKLEDFRAHGGLYGYYEIYRRNTEIGANGYTMVDGVRYYLGKGEDTKGCEVVKISHDLGGVVKIKKHGRVEHPEIVKVFKLVSEGEKDKITHEGEPYPRLSAKDIEAHGIWDANNFVNKFPESGGMVKEWEKFLEFSESLEDLGLGIVNFSVREQSTLWDVFSDRSKIKFKNYIGLETLTKEDKTNRIKTLLAISGSLKDISKVIEIGKSPNTGLLFENVAAISDIVGSVERFLSNDPQYSDVQLDRIRQVNDMILRHSSKLFLAAHEVTKNNEISIQDATNVLYKYRRDVESWYQNEFLRKSDLENNKYLQLLKTFDSTEEGSNMQTLLLSMIENFWEEDIVKESKNNKSTLKALERIKEFYDGNEELFSTSNETTADTSRELEGLKNFFSEMSDINGVVLDLACGDRKRITEPMADMLKGKSKLIGMDIWSPGKNEKENLSVIQGSIDSIPLQEDLVSVVTLNWSPPNDWVSRSEQVSNLSEIARVLKPGGIIRTDIPLLEGEEGSWLEEVKEQFKEGSEKFGDIKVMFPGGREGQFHIYPLAELKAMLMSSGFGKISFEPWQTSSGKPRVVVKAQYEGRANPIPQIF